MDKSKSCFLNYRGFGCIVLRGWLLASRARSSSSSAERDARGVAGVAGASAPVAVSRDLFVFVLVLVLVLVAQVYRRRGTERWRVIIERIARAHG